MEKKSITYDDLKVLVKDIHTEFPDYNHTKIANKIFVEKGLSINSRHIWDILDFLADKNWTERVSNEVDYNEIKRHNFPLFSDNMPNVQDKEYASIFKNISINEFGFILFYANNQI